MENSTVEEGKPATLENSNELKVLSPTLLQNKGIANPAMDYETAMTSPTELLSPEVFPEDITDLNGNAMCKYRDMVNYRGDSRSCFKSRGLVIALVIFIITTAVMSGLFAWRMLAGTEKTKTRDNETKQDCDEKTNCFTRTLPVNFEKIPTKIEAFLDNVREDIELVMKKEKATVTLMNVVYYDKVIWDVKYELKNNEMKDPANIRPYPVASVTKVITSLLAFKLFNDGNVTSLDDSITNYEPDFSIRNPFDNDDGKQISIRYLLGYLSGLPREAPCFPDNETNYCPHNNSYVLQRLKKKQLLFSPGSDILYGNLQFGLAGHALSRNYPGGYRELVHDKIFAPLGMRTSFFNVNDTVRKKMYESSDLGKTPTLKEWGWIDPAGGLLTTINDLAKLEIALFNNSKSHFLKSAVFDEFFSPDYFFEDGKRMLGCPWDIEFQKGYLIFGKGGYVYGYYSQIMLNPYLRLAVNLMSTSLGVSLKLSTILQNLTDLFHDELKNVSGNMRLVPVSNAKRFIGYYHTKDVPTLYNTIITISTSKIVNSTHQILAINLGGYRFDLAYIGDNVFEIVHKQCKYFALGVNREKIYFDESSDLQEKLKKFVIYGIHLRGKATFYRNV